MFNIKMYAFHIKIPFEAKSRKYRGIFEEHSPVK